MAGPSCMPCRGAAVSTERTNGSAWVGSDRALARAAVHWRGIVGLDTEFQRTDTFFPIPGLYQVASPSGIWLVDPLAVDDWTPLVEVLTDGDTVKVLHSCSEDLELLYRHLNVRPQNLFDTQLAYAFLSDTFSSSYANLVEALLGVALSKHHTRSNWLKRPLSEAQCRYAEEDVAYLLPLHATLKARLRAAGRWTWFLEDMQGRGRFAPREPESFFQGVKKAWKLDGGQLAVLKSLCEWREHRAMAEDVPRNRVVWDEHLVELAQRSEIVLADIRRILPPSVARRYGQDLVRAHGEGTQAPSQPPLPRPLGHRQGGVLKRLREVGRRQAANLDMAPELFARQRDLEQCIRQYRATGRFSETFLGWRHALLGDEFAAVLGERP